MGRARSWGSRRLSKVGTRCGQAPAPSIAAVRGKRTRQQEEAMPSLLAIIGGDSTPLKREMAAVEAMARKSGAGIQRGMSGGGAHSGSSGIIREFLVLTREMSAGNW